MESPIKYTSDPKDWDSPEEKKYGMKLPPDKGTLGFLDMEIHDCRQYLLIAEGVLKDITEEGPLLQDDPTEDINKICDRVIKLKSQCMRMANRPPTWQEKWLAWIKQ